ncbi:MAG: NAD(P)-dependent glycerol-3-phosphate dehydrogenase [Dehalococcoidales bacterium]|jgi:glycerol-3-phosphate dehydrogenase (NAD(P)+)|nr:NAD(P)-dependent glycerol-3-phosphate dehydrogenase [Dehalococcoidales bacterium]MDD4794481.1 NAD(P)-dependent glycerol-3-phosphate dehydrogenase [Dehalococcoidales bacterium]MDX9803463.1 NAD(P)H-dependent glycerol-3-phosphate dehydrogenase [Dehalococcoidales bacterium]
MQKIAIIGTTTWGITLSYVLANKGLSVYLWARTPQEAEKLSREGFNSGKIQGISFPRNLTVTADTEQALDKAEAVVLAVPSQTMRTNINAIKKHLKGRTLVISAAKGFELGSNKRMSEVIAEEIDRSFTKQICVLSGPNLYREILKGLPASSVIAAEKDDTARQAQKLLSAHNFSVFIQHDIIGVELGGALKNIIAIGAGMIDGFNYGDNAKAAFITRGLTEMSALSLAMGASPFTLSGLSGLGDLIATCASPLSRNHFTGYELSRGKTIDEIRKALGSEVSEGVTTTAAVWDIAQSLKLEMPITEKLYDILYRGAKPERIIDGILGIEGRHELAGKRWNLFSLLKRSHKG